MTEGEQGRACFRAADRRPCARAFFSSVCLFKCYGC